VHRLGDQGGGRRLRLCTPRKLPIVLVRPAGFCKLFTHKRDFQHGPLRSGRRSAGAFEAAAQPFLNEAGERPCLRDAHREKFHLIAIGLERVPPMITCRGTPSRPIPGVMLAQNGAGFRGRHLRRRRPLPDTFSASEVSPRTCCTTLVQ
jgi:hypothetical protein